MYFERVEMAEEEVPMFERVERVEMAEMEAGFFGGGVLTILIIVAILVGGKILYNKYRKRHKNKRRDSTNYDDQGVTVTSGTGIEDWKKEYQQRFEQEK